LIEQNVEAQDLKALSIIRSLSTHAGLVIVLKVRQAHQERLDYDIFHLNLQVQNSLSALLLSDEGKRLLQPLFVIAFICEELRGFLVDSIVCEVHEQIGLISVRTCIAICGKTCQTFLVEEAM
jgi:hypothetical protein